MSVDIQIPSTHDVSIQTDKNREPSYCLKWYYNNKERVLKQRREYYIKNRDKLLNRAKQKIKDNPEIMNSYLLKKIVCKCGDTLCYGSLTKHEKTKKHNQKINDDIELQTRQRYKWL
jgi:hypothetical protein